MKREIKYKVWSLYTIRELSEMLKNPVLQEYKKEKWRPARPIRYYSIFNDIKLAWLVFRRKADAFIWEDNEKQY